MTIAPSLLGEVTRYVADIRKAHDLLGWEPQVPLDEGIPRAVAWFREHRAAHPEEDKPVVNEGDSVGWKTLAADPVLSVLAHLRADGVRQDGRRRGDRGADPGRARLRRLDAGLPRPADPDEPGRRRAARRDLAARPPGDRRRVPGARARGDRRDRSRRAGRRSSSAAPGSGSRRRSPTSSCRRRPRRARASAGSVSTTAAAPRRRTRSSSGATRVRPRACTRTTASASSARSSSGRRAARSCRSSHASGPPSSGGRRSSSASTRRARRSPRGSAHARAAMFEQGVEDEVRAAGDVGAAGARPGGRADAAARGGDRRARARHAPLRRLPAQVDAPDPGHRHDRRGTAGGRGGGCDSRTAMTASAFTGALNRETIGNRASCSGPPICGSPRPASVPAEAPVQRAGRFFGDRIDFQSSLCNVRYKQRGRSPWRCR